MEHTFNQDSYTRTVIKWTSLFIFFAVLAISARSIHHHQLQKLSLGSESFNQKASLITKMHSEMLSMTRTQYQILHASDQSEVKQLLWSLSEQVSAYLVHYHQLEGIADDSDTEILMQFRTGFEQWHGFNKNLLGYANVISDSGFISTLNMIDLAFSQFDSNPDEALLLIAQLKQHVDYQEGVSN